MITKEQIIEILNNHAGYMDRSRTEQAVHEDNFNYVADEILSKLSQHDVIKNEVSVCVCNGHNGDRITGEYVYCKTHSRL